MIPYTQDKIAKKAAYFTKSLLCGIFVWEASYKVIQLVVAVTAIGDRLVLPWKRKSSIVASSFSAVMAQILDPLPPDQTGRILCCYVNATSKIQVARISNIANWYFERVVFPGQRLVFEAPPEALLEIHTGMMASAILSDKIPCLRLSINEESFDRVGTNVAASKEAVNNISSVSTIDKKTHGMTKPLTVVGLASID
jgi:hypothetical protein